MPRLKTASFFWELTDPLTSRPSLRSIISGTPSEDEERAVQYLRAGVLLAAAPSGPSYDYFDRSKMIAFDGVVVSSTMLTDGVWCWPGELAYYVQQYHVRLPEAFVAHMRENNWRVPSESEVDVSRFGTSDVEMCC